jgi:hypothetical protein
MVPVDILKAVLRTLSLMKAAFGLAAIESGSMEIRQWMPCISFERWSIGGKVSIHIKPLKLHITETFWSSTNP